MLLMDGCFRVGPWGPSVYEDIISLSRVKAKGLYCLSEFLNTGGKKTLFLLHRHFWSFFFTVSTDVKMLATSQDKVPLQLSAFPERPGETNPSLSMGEISLFLCKSTSCATSFRWARVGGVPQITQYFLWVGDLSSFVCFGENACLLWFGCVF